MTAAVNRVFSVSFIALSGPSVLGAETSDEFPRPFFERYDTYHRNICTLGQQAVWYDHICDK